MFGRRRRGEGGGEPGGQQTFESLRNRLVSGDPQDHGLRPSERYPHVWAALMEEGMSGAVVSLVSIVDGTTSLYISTGGGVIGAGTHITVAEATHRFLDAVERSPDLTASSENLPLPEQGQVCFNVLTYEGGRTAAAPRADLDQLSHPLRGLYEAAHGVIMELRLLDQS